MSGLKFIRDKQTITVQAPTTGLDYEYPSIFFTKKAKPQLVIKEIYKNIQGARDAFVNSLRASAPDLDAGKEFVYRFLLEQKETNNEAWSSFGIRIAEAGSEVGVWDLFEVALKPHDAPPEARSRGHETNCDLGLLVMFCSIYRMGSILDQGYMGQVSDRIMSQAVGIPDDIPKPDALIALVHGWLKNSNYLKIIAGIDMFLHRFPKSNLSQARVSTISSRYRDCSSLLSVRFFLHIIVSDVPENAAAWISHALDIIRMSKTGEEAAEGGSYFPYQSDLGLVKKSAYSTVINPSYFFFVHGIGALLGLERSRNARMNLEYGMGGTVSNVFWVAYVHKRNHVQTLQFTASGEQIVDRGDNTDTERDGLTIRSNSPIKWARFLESRDWVFTDFMKETIRKMQVELIETETRPGSIGAFLAKHSID